VRSYGQFCAVARALDVVGDRWSLLIVRDLVLRGPSRYTDLRNGLPGIATNLLADRLRALEEAGVVRRADPGPPVATTLYELTPWGAELAPVIQALGMWGTRLFARGRGDDAFRSDWLALPLGWLSDGAPGEPPATIEIRTGDGPLVVTVDGSVRTQAGAAEHPDAVIEGPPEAIVGLLLGRLDRAGAAERGVRIDGDASALARLRPPALPALPGTEPAEQMAGDETEHERSRPPRRRPGGTG
jgi:DNA-binding HxlR family transcriptional regulator